MELIRSGLAEHMRIYGTYPCPAPLGAPPDDVNYYRADCTITPVAGVGSGNVLIGAVPIDTLREVMSCKQMETPPPANIAAVFRENLRRISDVVDADTEDTNYKLDKTDCLKRGHIADEYRNKILYAVTQDATSLITFDPFDPSEPNIRILDADDNQATSEDQFFVLVSHGPDGKGAIDAEGFASGTPCGNEALDRDNENCDGDATFRDAAYSDVLGVPYYDDVVDFSLAGVLREDTYWHWAGDNPSASDGGMYVNPNVRVVLDTPGAGVTPNDRFVIGDGNIRVDGGGLTADNAIIATDGNIRANAGNVRAAAGNIDATTGNINATSTVPGQGEVSAGNAFVSPRYCYDAACDGI